MSQTPLISLIIPAYNVAPYLPQCLDSAIGQTYSNLEIIVVNDGSTDLTGTIIDRYAAQDPRIIALHQPNSGVMLTRKKAIESALGNYLCFLDGDDYLNCNAVEVLYEAMKKLKTDIVCADLVRVSKDYKIERRETWDGTIDGDTFMRYQLTNRMEGYLVAKLYKRSLFYGLRYPADISLAEDKLINIQIAAKGPTVGHVRHNVYNYVKRLESITHRTTPIEYNIHLIGYTEEILRKSDCYERFRNEFTMMQLKFYWLYICHTSSRSIARHPFTIRLYEQLREPEMKRMLTAYFSPEERAVIRLHKRPATAWMGKVLTTTMRIRQSIAKRTTQKKQD